LFSSEEPDYNFLFYLRSTDTHFLFNL